MEKIAADIPNCTHAILYAREAHAGAVIPAHKTLKDKRNCASLLKTELDEPRTVLVDGVEGAAHLAYGRMPNAIYIIDRERIVRLKALWSNAMTTHKALEAILAGKPAKIKSYFKPAKPWVVMSTAKRAGKGLGKDFFHGVPWLIWNALIKNNIRTFLK